MVRWAIRSDDDASNPETTGIRRVDPSTGEARLVRDAFLVVIHGHDVGRRVLLPASAMDGEPLVIGRSQASSIVLDHDGLSRRHCEIVRDAFGVVLRDLGSRNGTYVNDRRTDSAVLRDGDRVKIGGIVFKFVEDRPAPRPFYDPPVDGLSGLATRRVFDEKLSSAFADARANDLPFSLILVDIDRFKLLNDAHGHLAGDRVLRDLARRISGSVREGDVVARIGSEEFAVIALGVEAEDAHALAGTLHRRVSDEPFVVGNLQLCVTISGGVAPWSARFTSAKAMVRFANEQLLHAKNSGRNRVC
ncbi:MAG: GGDEF domain-containing protein [Myxococcota bacterium]